MWMADPHVISALREKRAELSGELIAAEKRILQLRDDIASLDRTIRVFDPTSEPHKIRPILRRKNRCRNAEKAWVSIPFSSGPVLNPTQLRLDQAIRSQ